MGREVKECCGKYEDEPCKCGKLTWWARSIVCVICLFRGHWWYDGVCLRCDLWKPPAKGKEKTSG